MVTILEEEPAAKILEQSRTTKNLVAKGWNGLRWGATISELRTAFPQAAKSGEWWVTGLGQETFCGLLMDTQYAFNKREVLYLVAFYPSVADRVRVAVAALNELGAPDDETSRWTAGDVIVEVKMGGVGVAMIHQKLAAR